MADILKKIKEDEPRIIYVSGKSCTGKSTFSRKIKDFLGYSIVDLGSIVFKSVIEPFSVDPSEAFITIYRDQEPKEQVSAFIEAVKSSIESELKSSPVIVEGAIAKSRILEEIFSDELKNFMFIYLHPTNHSLYANRIKQRFVNGATKNTTELPKDFWKLVNKNDFEEFIRSNTLNMGMQETINQYATLSMKESRERLRQFQKNFSGINVVEI